MPRRVTMLRLSRTSDGLAVLEIWRRAFHATHDFLTPEDRADIDLMVSLFLPHSPLMLAVDQREIAVGSMGLSGNHLDCLFIYPNHHRLGIGSKLIALARSFHCVVETELNEQNHGARRFYARLGFVPFARSPVDEQGWPYPLLHLRRDPSDRMLPTGNSMLAQSPAPRNCRRVSPQSMASERAAA